MTPPANTVKRKILECGRPNLTILLTLDQFV